MCRNAIYSVNRLCLVVDKLGYLWTGSGPFLYGDAGTHSVLRFDTSTSTVNSAAILAVTIPDEANVRTSWLDAHLCQAGLVRYASEHQAVMFSGC